MILLLPCSPMSEHGTREQFIKYNQWAYYTNKWLVSQNLSPLLARSLYYPCKHRASSFEMITFITWLLKAMPGFYRIKTMCYKAPPCSLWLLSCFPFSPAYTLRALTNKPIKSLPRPPVAIQLCTLVSQMDSFFHFSVAYEKQGIMSFFSSPFLPREPGYLFLSISSPILILSGAPLWPRLSPLLL